MVLPGYCAVRVVAGSNTPVNDDVAGCTTIAVTGPIETLPSERVKTGVANTVPVVLSPAYGLPVTNAGTEALSPREGVGEPTAVAGTSTRTVPSVPPDIGYSVSDLVVLPV